MAHFRFVQKLGWASDANYPAGAHAWNGLPTKVAPSAAAIAGGVTPDQFPAERFNWVINFLGDNPVEFAMHRAMQEWDARIMMPDADISTLTVGLGSGRSSEDQARALSARGGETVIAHYILNSAASPRVSQAPSLWTVDATGQVLYSFDQGLHWGVSGTISPATPAAGVQFPYSSCSVDAVGATAGRVIFGVSGSSTIYLFTPAAPGGSSFVSTMPGISAMHFNASPLNRAFAGGWHATTPIETNDSGGIGAWTARTISGWATAIASRITAIVSADNSNCVVATARNQATVAVSSDGGNSWSLVAPGVTAPSGGSYAIAWNEYHKLFVLSGTTGFATSPTGATGTWTVYTATTGPTPSEMAVVFNGRGAVAIGPITAFLCWPTRETVVTPGIFWTTDFLSWQYTGLGFLTGDPPPLQMAVVGSRLAAFTRDSGVLHLSGALGLPLAEATYSP